MIFEQFIRFCFHDMMFESLIGIEAVIEFVVIL